MEPLQNSTASFLHPGLLAEPHSLASTAAPSKTLNLPVRRRKDLKNPRKKNRMKFAQAEVRRRGQVQTVREQSKRYGGEQTGIKSKVSKSRKFR